MKLRIVLLVALLLSLGVGAAGAQGTVSYTSGFQIQNLEGTVASILLDFYDQAGNPVASQPYSIDPNSSKTFFPINDVAAGFNGSLVINSSNNVRAINNLVGSGPANYFATTNGFQSGAASVNLPLIMCNNSGFDTWFNVQNAGAGDASVTITYTPGSDGTARTEGPITIKPGAAKTFNQTAGSPTMNCTTAGGGLAGPSGKFIGSAVINSTQPVVAAVMQLNTTGFKVLMGYGGFTGGSPTVALPLLMANNSNMYTGMQIQNAGSVATNVTVTYSPNTVGAGTPAPETFSVAPGASKTIIMSGSGGANNWSTFGRYIGGATVTNSGNQPLVAIVNQVLPSPALGSAYEGFNPANATANASAPLIMANNSTYYTGIQVQNVSGSQVSVTIDYGPNSAGAFNPANETFTLAAGASKTIIQNGTAAQNGGANNWGTNKYIGSASITATGGNIVAIVNQVSFGVAGDQLATGDAFNY